MITIRFTNQSDLQSVQSCIAEVFECGGIVHSSSFTEAEQVVDLVVDIADQNSFRDLFIQTSSYLISDYH